MSKHVVTTAQLFNCSTSTLFDHLSNPFNLATALAMPCEVIKTSDTAYPYGIGMQKRIKASGLPNFDEVITDFEPNAYIAYKVIRGGVVKDHKGELRFSATPSGSQLEYKIQFSPRWPFPFLGKIIAHELQKTLDKGLTNTAQILNAQTIIY